MEYVRKRSTERSNQKADVIFCQFVTFIRLVVETGRFIMLRLPILVSEDSKQVGKNPRVNLRRSMHFFLANKAGDLRAGDLRASAIGF